ncbi:hypothetical protein [Streptomyces sp. NPDC058155]
MWVCTLVAHITDLPVETIAHQVGLSSPVNLCRRFHEALRTTPAA